MFSQQDDPNSSSSSQGIAHCSRSVFVYAADSCFTRWRRVALAVSLRFNRTCNKVSINKFYNSERMAESGWVGYDFNIYLINYAKILRPWPARLGSDEFVF